MRKILALTSVLYALTAFFLLAETGSEPPRSLEINAAEIIAASTLDLPDPAEAAEFDKTFSKPLPINDGIKRNYILATDELYQPATDGVGQILRVKDAHTPSELAQVADILSTEYRLETRLVMYRAGTPKNEATRRILSREVVVKTDNRGAAIQAATETGLRLKSEPAYSKGFLVFTSETPTQAIESTEKMRSLRIANTRPLFLSFGQPEFLPDDPYFKDEWHIRGRGQNGAKKASDAKITPIWQYRDWETDRKSTRLNSSHRL